MTYPLNDFLGYADDTSTWIGCDNDHVLIDVWNLVRFLRCCSEDDVARYTLHNGSLMGFISAPKSLSYKAPERHVVWKTGDAAFGAFRCN